MFFSSSIFGVSRPRLSLFFWAAFNVFFVFQNNLLAKTFPSLGSPAKQDPTKSLKITATLPSTFFPRPTSENLAIQKGNIFKKQINISFYFFPFYFGSLWFVDFVWTPQILSIRQYPRFSFILPQIKFKSEIIVEPMVGSENSGKSKKSKKSAWHEAAAVEQVIVGSRWCNVNATFASAICYFFFSTAPQKANG